MKKTSIIFFLILFISLFLRVYKLDQSPPGFYSDESLTGYEAYSILKTGRDQYGNFLPITFKAFGDYRPGLSIYATVPFIWFFGLNEFAVRFPSAIYSILTGVMIYLLSRDFFKNEKVALFSFSLFALSPWSLQFARMSHETNLATLLTTAALYFFLKGIAQKNKMLFMSASLFGLSMYAYYTTRVFVPLFVFALFTLFREKLFAHKKKLILSILIGLLILVPLSMVLINREQGWSRIDAVSLWGDQGITARIIQYRQEDNLSNNALGRVFHNKIIDMGKAFATALFSHIEPQFLLFNGDPVKLYNTPGNGILLWMEPIFLIIAAAWLWRQKFQYNRLICAWIIFGLFPDMFTRLYPAAARIHLLLPLISILGGYGWWQVWQWAQKREILGVGIKIAISFFIIGNSIYFLHSHFVHTRIAYAKEWHFGVKEVALEAQMRETQYKKIWVSKSVWGWINFVFFQRYDPYRLQQEIILSEKNEYGLGWVYAYGNYYHDSMPAHFDLSQNILYIATPEEFPIGVKPLHIVQYPDTSVAFYLVDTAGLKEFYEKQ